MTVLTKTVCITYQYFTNERRYLVVNKTKTDHLITFDGSL